MANEEQKDKGVAKMPSGRGLGVTQKAEANLATTEDLKEAQKGEEGVGDVAVYTNPKYGDAIELNEYDDEGNLVNSQTFKAKKLHHVSAELADTDLFVRVEQNEG